MNPDARLPNAVLSVVGSLHEVRDEGSQHGFYIRPSGRAGTHDDIFELFDVYLPYISRIVVVLNGGFCRRKKVLRRGEGELVFVVGSDEFHEVRRQSGK